MMREFRGIEVEVVRGQAQVYDYSVSVEQFEADVERIYRQWEDLAEVDREWYEDFAEYFDDVYHGECYPED